MQKTTDFLVNADRYQFDGSLKTADGWCQFDTSQDAWYFGQWTNPITLEFVSYVEGEYTRNQYESEAEYIEFVKQAIAFDGFIHIDVGIGSNRQDLLDKFSQMGLGTHTA